LARRSGNAQLISNPYPRKSSVLSCSVALYERKKRRQRMESCVENWGSFLRSLAIDSLWGNNSMAGTLRTIFISRAFVRRSRFPRRTAVSPDVDGAYGTTIILAIGTKLSKYLPVQSRLSTIAQLVACPNSSSTRYLDNCQPAYVYRNRIATRQWPTFRVLR
jgi:hypothetical protein